MRAAFSSGCITAAGGTLLLLVAAVWIAQPNLPSLGRLFDQTVGALLDGGDSAEAQVRVEDLAVEPGRVRGRVVNASKELLHTVTVRLRLLDPGSAPRPASATLYQLAPGQEAWFGVPLFAGDGVTAAELAGIDVSVAQRDGSPAPPRTLRGTGGGMRDVERAEREMGQMQDAARSVGR